jgi:PAS domain S-box-containing protein
MLKLFERFFARRGTRQPTGQERAEQNLRYSEEHFQQLVAEANQAQQAERRHRQQLHVTLSSIGDAVIVTDNNGLVTFLNPVAQALTGWEPQDAAGQPLERVFRILNEETRQVVENPVARVLREGVVVGLGNHTLLLSRDGREIPIDDSGAPIRGEDGVIAGVVLVFRDVTEVRRAIEARLHLAAIVESSEDAIISKNLDGIIVSLNEAAERLYGYTAEEMIGKPLSRLVPPDHPNELPELLERIKRGERIHHYQTQRMRKDGTRLDVSLTISPVKSADGKVIGASKSARDITALKRQEKSLRFLAEASKLLAEVLDVPSTLQRVAGLAVPEFADWCAVDLLADDGQLRRVAVGHVDPAKIELAHDLYRRFPPDPNAPGGTWHVLRTRQSEMVSEITDALLDATVPDPEWRRILQELGLRSYIGAPLTVRGKTLGVISFIGAESGRRFGQADLRLAEDLAQRTAIAIDNARLYAELKEADRQKNDWIAMLAHELRNPLAPIRNALHLMGMPGVNGAALNQARQMAERQVGHMVRLVDDLLNVSRIIHGRVELRRESVDLANVVARGAETAQPMIDAQGQQLIVTVPPEPLLLEGDPTRLAQIVSNLLHNAAKFSERSGRIWLTAERQKDEAVVRVRDEGAGIPASLLPRIFDLFSQGDRSIERTQGGLGIGLTLVRKLVELHGGTITAQSASPGQGSEFVVRLPAVLQPRRQEVVPACPPLPPASVARRVLVVDDNVDAAESMATLLRLWGHQVRLAHNGPEALQAAGQCQPEVVVLDIGLPGMNGYEVARFLRQDPRFGQPLLVAVTGYGEEEDQRRSTEAGFDRHLVKPVAPEALRQVVAAQQ